MNTEPISLNDNSKEFHCRYSSSIDVPAKADELFNYLDDQKKLSSHMSKSSWMMAGSSMTIELDKKEARELGSEIILRGSMMGIPLFIREVVIERKPPLKKAWQTVGPQEMIIIDQYRMGFEIEPKGEHSKLTVFIDYDLPTSGIHRITGLMFGKMYAKWCTEMMTKDAAHSFRNS